MTGFIIFIFAIIFLFSCYHFLMKLAAKRLVQVKLTGHFVQKKETCFDATVFFENKGKLPVAADMKLLVENPVTLEEHLIPVHMDLGVREKRSRILELCMGSCGRWQISFEGRSAGSILILPNHLYTESNEMTKKMAAYTELLNETDLKGLDDTEYISYREYQPGDSIKKIHWKLSGKQEKLIIREGAMPLSYHQVIILDPGSGGEISEKMAETFLTLVSEMMNQNIELTAVFYGLYKITGEEEYDALLDRVLKVRRDGRDMLQFFYQYAEGGNYDQVFYVTKNKNSVTGEEQVLVNIIKGH